MAKNEKKARTTTISGPAKTAGMPADGTWPLSVVGHLRKLGAGLRRNEALIAEMTKTRDALNAELEDLGDNQPEKEQRLSVEWRHAIQRLSAARLRVKWYANQIAEAIPAADQGELFESARTEPDEDDLLFKGPRRGAWKKRTVESIEGLRDGAIKALKEAGLHTLGDVDERTEPLERVQGLTLSDAELVRAEVLHASGRDALED